MIKKLLFTLFLVFVQTVSFAQATGDYRSQGSGDWLNKANWQYYNGSSWVTPSGTAPQGYPGQFTGTGSVLVQAGHAINIGSAGITTNAIGTITISGSLLLNGLSNSIINYNIVTQNIIVNATGYIGFFDKVNLKLPSGASIQLVTGESGLRGDCSNNQSIYMGPLEFAACKGNSEAGFTFQTLIQSGGTLNAIVTAASPVCAGNTINLTGSMSGPIGTGLIYTWSIKDPNNITTTVFGKNTNIVSSIAGNYVVTLTCTTSYDGNSFSNSESIPVRVNPLPTAAGTITGPATVCQGQSGVSYSVPAITNATSYSWAYSGAGATITGATRTPTITFAANATSGNLTVYGVNACGNGTVSANYAVTVNAVPTAPATSVTQPICTISTGTITVAAQAGLNYSIDGINYTNTTGIFYNVAVGTYNVSAKNASGCISRSTPVSIIAPVTATWNVVSGVGAWTNGPPTSAKALIFSGNYNSETDTVATVVEGCSCKVNSGAAVVFTDGKTLKISNEVKVLGSGTLTFENNASLVQINDVVNTGDIIYKRETRTTVNKFDFTYWSSPVSKQTLYQLSPETLWDKYFSYNAADNKWVQENSSKEMQPGIGYIIRGPQSHIAPNPINTYRATFIGVPHNGTIVGPEVTKGEAYYLVGNPYPSALDADKFLMANSSVLTGTLYFWTHKTPIGTNVSNPGSGVYAYSSDDYATYNLTGGIGTNGARYDKGGAESLSGSVKPTGEIAAGQSFFTISVPAPVKVPIVFKNNMRLGNEDKIMDNSQFFKVKNKTKKTNALERHRFWLNLTNSQGAFKQMLVGYITGATNGYDTSFDGQSFNGNQFVNFYSVNEDKNLTIQGRALPFDKNDIIPLGYSSTIQGGFSISIDEVDGLFINQNIIVEDKVLNVTHDLKNGPYNFTTEKGTFDERFVLRYTNKTLATADFELDEESVLISKDNSELKIKSQGENINQITVFDLLGRKVFDKTGINANEFQTSNVKLTNQVVLVKVSLTNGKVITKKVLY
ncbi:T9SS sorting signal type C domain-containing protein [Flavobacterium caseinilyticum]|uniref:T9SS type A sorting domain-containing protein n=1 Tax=Flavobacterium caseinilyticum TaxID=2541732 RepID=A0A4V2YUK1_9FLAO|nr:T9SS sorting signal type C domain-containing protein [Flavobacterium caseinilyticum]TDD78077.1 T9SS type A sorting domain-containing protein [Flavobacterium caseinilyticum]